MDHQSRVARRIFPTFYENSVPEDRAQKKKEKKTNAIDPMTSQVDFSRRLSERHPTWSKRRSTKPNVSLLKPADKEPNL